MKSRKDVQRDLNRYWAARIAYLTVFFGIWFVIGAYPAYWFYESGRQTWQMNQAEFVWVLFAFSGWVPGSLALMARLIDSRMQPFFKDWLEDAKYGKHVTHKYKDNEDLLEE